MIEEQWSLFDYRELKAFWTEQPPPHVALLLVGAALGIDWGKVREGMKGKAEMEQLAPDDGPSIADLAAAIKTPPVAKGSTLAASVEALRRLGAGRTQSLH